MPELPEVETIVRGLRRHVVGRTIDNADRADLEQEGEKLLAFLTRPETSRHLSVAVVS